VLNCGAFGESGGIGVGVLGGVFLRIEGGLFGGVRVRCTLSLGLWGVKGHLDLKSSHTERVF